MPRYFRFRVELESLQPPIWRRFLLPVGATFADLHEAIQTAGPWEGRHGYCFRSDRSGEVIAVPRPQEDEPEAKARYLMAYFADTRIQSCLYDYDPGDGWSHRVELEEIDEIDEIFQRRLLAGSRAFPREDMGGPGSYRNLVAALAIEGGPPDWARKRVQRLRGWDPEFFDLEIARLTCDSPGSGAPFRADDTGANSANSK